MKSSEIKYISFFDFQDSPVQRNYVTAATNKIESICDSLIKAGYKVKIVSVASVIAPSFKLYKGCTIRRNDNLSLRLFFSWGGMSKLLRQIRMVWHLVALFFYLLIHTSKDEPVIVYHSLGYFNVILWAKKIKRFKLILEVEEIYQDVGVPKFKRMARYENEMFKVADAYIFPTELLNAKLNLNNKPYVIIYGTYRVEPQIVEKFDDGKIHVVYAGTFDSNKGGCEAAILSLQYLPENYHLHICGFGNQEDTSKIISLIKQVREESVAEISFEGLKIGTDYIILLQKCHIGLSSQNPNANFNDTSFPSKILSYMANGLSVVSVRIPAIERASISPNITFYDKQSPQDIAYAIKHVSLLNDNRKLIEKLYVSFVNDLPKILCR